MPRRLVVLGSTETALAVVRDAHAHGLAPIVVDTQAGTATHSRRAAGTIVLSEAQSKPALERVLSLGGDDSLLIATGDVWLKWLMPHRAALEERFTVLHPSNAALELCLSKERFAAWCVEKDFPVPVSWVADGQQRRPEGLVAPFLIRPAQTEHGAAARDARLPKAVEARDEGELADWLARFAAAGRVALVSESLLAQPLIQYSIPFARRGDRCVAFVARKVRPAPERCAVGTLVELSPEPQLEALGRCVAEALDYFGVGELEVLHSRTTGSHYLIELNARPWLQYALAPASGHDFLGVLLQRERATRQIKRGKTWLDFHADLFNAFSSSMGAVRHGQLSVADYLTALLRANVFARFDLFDPAPAFARRRPAAAAAVARPSTAP